MTHILYSGGECLPECGGGSLFQPLTVYEPFPPDIKWATYTLMFMGIRWTSGIDEKSTPVHKPSQAKVSRLFAEACVSASVG